jgi:hypothetical protein
MKASSAILPQSVAGKAINDTLKRWAELTRFIDHPIVELSTMNMVPQSDFRESIPWGYMD